MDFLGCSYRVLWILQVLQVEMQVPCLWTNWPMLFKGGRCGNPRFFTLCYTSFMYMSFTQSFQQSSINQPIMGGYDWCLNIFQDIQEVTVPIECLLYAEATNSAKAPNFIPGFFELFNCRRMEWPEMALVTDPSSSTNPSWEAG